MMIDDDLDQLSCPYLSCSRIIESACAQEAARAKFDGLEQGVFTVLCPWCGESVNVEFAWRATVTEVYTRRKESLPGQISFGLQQKIAGGKHGA